MYILYNVSSHNNSDEELQSAIFTAIEYVSFK